MNCHPFGYSLHLLEYLKLFVPLCVSWVWISVTWKNAAVLCYCPNRSQKNVVPFKVDKNDPLILPMSRLYDAQAEGPIL